MTRYPIGTRCVIVAAPVNQKVIGKECIIVGHHNTTTTTHPFYKKPCDYKVEINGEVAPWPFTYFECTHEQLRPIDDRPANTVTSWESCPFQPEREVAA